MIMPGCIYKIRDRLMVPGVEGVQGIVIACLESIANESVYTLKWFDLNAEPVEDSFTESTIKAAQAPAPDWLPEISFVAEQKPEPKRKRSSRRRAKR
jgi:hypothetical protein